MNSGEENDCVYWNRPKRQCSGARSCNKSVYESAKVNREEYLQKEQDREFRARTELPNVVRTKRTASDDGHLL